MRSLTYSVLGIALIAVVAFYVSCGQVNQAPVGATVTLNIADSTITQQCVVNPIDNTDICNNYPGAYVYFVIAVVQDTNSRTIVGGVTPTGGTPINGVEVQFNSDGKLYLWSDDLADTKLKPLSQPYKTKTDESGIARVKWVLPTLSQCGSEFLYNIMATAGAASDGASVTMTCEASSSGDDDSTSDDDSGG